MNGLNDFRLTLFLLPLRLPNNQVALAYLQIILIVNLQHAALEEIQSLHALQIVAGDVAFGNRRVFRCRRVLLARSLALPVHVNTVNVHRLHHELPVGFVLPTRSHLRRLSDPLGVLQLAHRTDQRLSDVKDGAGEHRLVVLVLQRKVLDVGSELQDRSAGRTAIVLIKSSIPRCKIESHRNVNFSSIFFVLPTHESKQTALSRGIDTSGTSRSDDTSLMTYLEFPNILRSALT